jgi:hypothetical protein
MSELQLADTVRIGDDAFGFAVVTQIADGLVHFFRPYAHTADFSYTGGVMTYVGIETWTVALDSSTNYELINRKTLR